MKVALPPELKRRVARKVAGGLYQDAGDVIRDALRACLDESGDRIISQAGLGGMDVSETAFLVLASATKDMDDDIKTIMAEIKAINAAKAKLHDEIEELNRWIAEQLTSHESNREIENDTVSPASPRRAQSHPGRTCVEILMSIMDTLQANLDSMNEMSEMTSLRLQMAMDRRSKFIETLSNIMKKIAATQSAMVQNLK